MARLEELTAGSIVLGIAPQEAVTIVAAQWYGNAVLDITYKDSRGNPGTRLLYREDESSLTLQKAELPWSFDADGAQLRLASEAWRIHYAHLFDPYLAVHTSDVEPLPHQISAVYQELLGRLPLRYILADDPGAGKTIMTGLFIKELIARGDLKRCLIVSPGSLAEQWQDELFRKFHLRFEILNNERIDIVPWDEDIRKFAANALLPAKVQSVEVDEEKHELRVIVADDQSKVAFGRKAQNVRLSAKLLGWNIKLCDENTKSRGPSIDEQIRAAAEKLAEAAGISTADAGKLVAAGFVTVDGLKAADLETISAIEGLNFAEVSAAIGRLKD